jgi:ATP-dependent RNA helicase DDX10/DBP4
LAEVEGINKRL